ncbi:MAG TPA: hypothetical protein VEQ66_13910 [Propionibacteriaceae bacterium]|nr:hypothetical protein [Propionibacteriaceae bacterium]
MADDTHDFAQNDQQTDVKRDDVQQFSSGGQVSEGPSSLSDSETSLGGADSVPDTPDTMPPVQRGAGPEAITGE